MNDSLKLVRQLVEDFQQQEAYYLGQAYQESEARTDFIDKFFAALGWDVTHSLQKNPYEQEVKIENKVKTQGSQRRADYAFFIGPNFRDVKFFAEAKKPSRNLANLDDYYQAIRYAWNSNTPIAVLTDFEEFHVLDCRYKPDKDTALNRKIEAFHYSDYLDPEKFARIFHLFGRDAVANGSIEKFSASLPKPRGKAIQKGLFKGGYQQVDEAFLEVLDEYRETLAKAFKASNPGLDGEELTEAVQRTIDRLVFIRFLEDKTIEDRTIADYAHKPSAWKAFAAHCRSLEPRYNGLLFKHHRVIDGEQFRPPDNDLFADICNDLSDPSSPYDFDKIPISILGSIYERFLGKVVHATEKRVKIEEKPEVRKAGGVYYTPEYIVRYIVKETVGKLIENKTPDQIAGMAFADIACGSGSFLLEVYGTLLEYHTRWYNAHPEKAKKADVETRESKLMLSLKKRQEILTNNVYGVDIDFQATEVTQLSLYLKLLEDVTLSQLHLFKEKVLPDLKRNIVCGNSLIEPDIETQTSLFHPTQPSNPSRTLPLVRGGLGGVSDTDALKPMRFTDAFPDVMKKGGFDAIVGNPPYVQSRSEQLSEGEKKYYLRHYQTAEYQVNTFGLFIERGHLLLKQHGFFGMIIPNYWLSTRFDKKLRRFLFLDNQVSELLNLYSVFANVTVDALILISQRSAKTMFPKEFIARSIDRKLGTIQDRLDAIRQSRWTFERNHLIQHDDGDVNISFGNEIDLHSSDILGNYFDFKFGMKPYQVGKGKPPQTRKSVDSKAFSARQKIDKTYEPLLRAGGLKRFRIEWEGDWIKYGEHLAEPRSISLFSGQRILVQRIVSDIRLHCCITDKILVCNTDIITLKPKNSTQLKHHFYFFLGILGSLPVGYYLRSKNINLDRKAFPKINTETLSTLPIPSINFSDPAEKARHDQIVKLVEQMLAAKEKLATAKTDSEVNRLEMQCESLDRQIDAAVYELYGLTEEEIRIVEGKA